MLTYLTSCALFANASVSEALAILDDSDLYRGGYALPRLSHGEKYPLFANNTKLVDYSAGEKIKKADKFPAKFWT